MIDRDELLESITTEDVIEILTKLGSREPILDNQGDIFFQTVCHGGEKQKLQYFIDSKMFMCYTNCGSMSLYDLLMNVNNWTFYEAFTYLLKYKGIKENDVKVGLQCINKNTDLDFLDKHLTTIERKEIKLPSFNKGVLNVFDDYCPDIWVKEGISIDVMKYYGIKFYFEQYKAIIPHLDRHGNLVGIKGRNFLQYEIDNGKKYIPVTIQGLTYRYPNNFNLYGLYQNKENIKKYKKAIVFEGEKSVLKYASLYGQDNNISVASLGMGMSLYQRDLLIESGVEELIIAYDKQYMIEALEDKTSEEYKECIKYLKMLYKTIKLFINYCNVSVILCWDNRLDYKSAPIDHGKEVFEELLSERHCIIDEDLEKIKEMIK